MTDLSATDEGGQPVTRDRRRDVRLVLTGVVGVLLVWFAVANLQDVPIHFWLTSTRSPLILVVVISGILGSAATMLLGRVRRRHSDD